MEAKPTPINLKQKHAEFTKQWHPHQIAKVDNMQVLLAKVQGEFVWHAHENEDELFQVLKGTLHMQFRDRTEVVKEGEIIVIPKGVEHNPMTKNDEVVHVLLFEKLSTSHTGNVLHEKTQTEYPKI
ncbi:mannose-6-phosphate isomerase-like protein (cupin superfamily) [Saonia flava]|uniref:Mannose-6-phosphate isomerase-like protein (Cupin superfamily) n=1 Tax=Saonia flava TaxID=523696 RepID=A0A846QUT4_9FLAO|nr:cupin domain-containing protein [Saonia flava]NJB71788.1 mannose-6-phosphate isomerase-like protein (cupin superfamily) [Saonia flava]